jgi:ribosomal-protein-alanine N-acetyltransferase
MHVSDLADVAQIETRIFAFPWTVGNFSDSLAAGYDAWVFESSSGAMLGYAMLMWLPDEVHLLNLSVDESMQGRGLGEAWLRWLLDNMAQRGARSMLLECRPSNTVGLRLYERTGFARIGLRRRYYPAAGGTREDAIVMARRLGNLADIDDLESSNG